MIGGNYIRREIRPCNIPWSVVCFHTGVHTKSDWSNSSKINCLTSGRVPVFIQPGTQIVWSSDIRHSSPDGLDVAETPWREQFLNPDWDTGACPDVWRYISLELACTPVGIFIWKVVHRGTLIGGRGRAQQKHNLFRARSSPIVGAYVSTPLLTLLTLANLLVERPLSGIAFYVGIRRTPP